VRARAHDIPEGKPRRFSVSYSINIQALSKLGLESDPRVYENKEMDESAFFSLGDSGGTRMASAYALALDIIEKRWPALQKFFGKSVVNAGT